MGGALYIIQESLEIFNSEFIHNKAEKEGGAIYVK